MEKLHILLQGKEEPCGIKTTTQRIAQDIGLKGFVRDTVRGELEIMAEGNPEQLHRLVDWAKYCNDVGKETEMFSNILPYEGTYKHFEIL